MKNLLRSHFAALLGILLSTGCATYRSFPSHGGGKRFDEEQRIVAAVIHDAVNQIDLSQIQKDGGGKQGVKKRVHFEVISLETSGNASANYPGLSDASLSVGYNYRQDNIQQRQIPLRTPLNVIGPAGPEVLTPQNFGNAFGGQNSDEDGSIYNVNPEAKVSYQFNPFISTRNQNTRQDLDYLSKAVELSLRSNGFEVVDLGGADYTLIILVDVLGTNLSRLDDLVLFKDKLEASCEVTYYVLNPKNQDVIQGSKFIGSRASFHEYNIRFSPIRANGHQRSRINSSIVPLAKVTGHPPKNSEIVVASALSESDGGSSSSTSKKASKLEGLYSNALEAIDAEDAQGLKKTINRIEKIDPDYDRLPELKLELEGI